MTQRIIKTPADLEKLIAFLGTRKLPLTVEITDGRDRSKEQNGLAFKWYGEISAQTGEAIEDVRARCKLRFGLPILMEASEGFRDLCRRRIKPLTHAERIEVIRQFDIPVTRLMNVGQMSRFMDEMFQYHAEFGLVLTVPEDQFAFSPNSGRKVA